MFLNNAMSLGGTIYYNITDLVAKCLEYHPW